MKTDQITPAEQIVRAMDHAWAENDVEGLVALFAPTATIESPIIPRLLNQKEGICRGREEIRGLVRALMQRGRPWSGHETPIVQGHRVAIEYTRPTPEGKQLYSVDIIEILDGKIQSLRAYVGWRAGVRQDADRRAN